MKEILAMGLHPFQVRKSLTTPPSPRQQAKTSQARQRPHIRWLHAYQNLAIGLLESTLSR